MKQAVIIKPYDFRLLGYFAKEKKFLNKRLSKNIRIYHIGSSAVPGLGGKNVVDIILLTSDKKRAKKLVKKLELLGYIFDPNAGDDHRIFFKRHYFQDKKIIYIVHLHLMWQTEGKYKDYLLFRDYLRVYSQEARRYYQLKKIWAKKAGLIRHKFPAMKTGYVAAILKKAQKENIIDFKNLRDKNILVMGLGLLGGGVETVQWLVKQGASVLVTDLKTKKELSDSLNKLKGLKIRYVLGKHQVQDFVRADLIIKNPGVPRDSKFLKIAKKNNIPIESDLSLFFRLFKGKIIGVTGTKGKSTTVSLLAHILKTAKKKFVFGGNIGQSPLNQLSKNYPLAILEISSWQLEDLAHLKKSPDVAVITTIFPDHLDTYKNFADYVEAKKTIFKFQTKNNILILNASDLIVKKFAKEAKAKIIYFFPKGSSYKISDRLNRKTKIFNSNVLAATSVALVLKIPLTLIKKAIKTFRGVLNRLEFICEKNGIKYYNDSASTIPQSTILALNSLANKRNIVLISGGADKKLDFSKMAQRISKTCKAVVLLPGTATPEIEKELGIMNYKLKIRVKTMEEATKVATAQAKKGDIVLLSPGCASFGLFKNVYDRATQFVKRSKKL